MPSLEQRITGVCAATLTPLNDRWEPDHALLLAHCRRLLANGCDAINLLGTTGEATSLSVAARFAVMEAVAASDLPIERFMVGTGAAAFADALALTRAAVEREFSGALVIPPFYYKSLTDDGVVRFYDRLIDAIDDSRLRLYLYNYPQLTGFTFSPQIVARLVGAYPAIIVGIKDSSAVPGYPESIIAACPTIDVFPSSEALLADGRARGFAGCISASANVTGPIATRLWHGADPTHATGLTAIRSMLTKHQLIPALRAVAATLFADAAWLRVLPPLIELSPSAASELLAELDTIPEFPLIREAFGCG